MTDITEMVRVLSAPLRYVIGMLICYSLLHFIQAFELRKSGGVAFFWYLATTLHRRC